jgi:deoxyhypusine synthase
MSRSPQQTSKPDLLNRPIEHIDITSFDARPIVSAMADMSFSAREIAHAAEIYDTMIKDPDATIILTLAGSTQAAGLMALYADLVEHNMVDCIVATGAAVVDMDFFEALGYRHYRGQADSDDEALRALRIDRIHDTFIDEDELKACDYAIRDLAGTLKPGPWSSRGLISEMGRWLAGGAALKPGSLVERAYRHKVPVFCPAFTDSSAGFGLILHQDQNPDRHVTLDAIRDFRELTDLKIAARTTGLFMIGGGVPKNFAQDIVIAAELLGQPVPAHKYGVQITVADVRDGACSSSTLDEAGSWGKVERGMNQMVFGEATSILPLIASDVYHRGNWRIRKRRHWQNLFD